jgi:hypothetical protein
MKRNALCALTASFALSAFVACDGSDIVVFSNAASGSAGVSAMLSGAGGDAAGADARSGSAGSLSGGGTGGDVGGGGASGAGASGAGGSDMQCRNLNDCLGPTWLCAKQGCGDAMGICRPRQFTCDPVYAPVCGCDHVTYWNDCLRDQYGVPASTVGKCGGGARACDTSADCGPGANCSHFLPPNVSCGQPPGAGNCWVTPMDCPTNDDSKKWTSCPAAGSGQGGQGPCLTTCQAVQSGLPSVPPQHGACP